MEAGFLRSSHSAKELEWHSNLLVARNSQPIAKARWLVGNFDVGAKAAGKWTEDVRAEPAAGAVLGWRFDSRAIGLRPVEGHAAARFRQLDVDVAVGRRQRSILEEFVTNSCRMSEKFCVICGSSSR